LNSAIGGGSPVAANVGEVNLYPVNGFPGAPAATDAVCGSGNFSFTGLPAGNYAVEFISRDTRAVPVREWFDDWRFVFDAETLTLTDGVPYVFGDIVLEHRHINPYRVFGASRFATAVAIGQPGSPDGADRHVIIVNGLTFPDALSAGPCAGRDASPMLMVTANSIPPETQAELDRLDPDLITIIGGTGSIAAGIASQISGLGVSVDRLVGERWKSPAHALSVHVRSDGSARQHPRQPRQPRRRGRAGWRYRLVERRGRIAHTLRDPRRMLMPFVTTGVRVIALEAAMSIANTLAVSPATAYAVRRATDRCR